jgi:ubiquinone/menaquinone biosynthesis C-methylase UbiE
MTPFARWYSNATAGYLDDHRRTARLIADRLPVDARVLEIAPGPGYLAIELAKLGRYRVSGLDISTSFVKLGIENARRAGVEVEFRLGDAHALPFPADEFDFIVCAAQMHVAGAAFWNFRDPVKVLAEMRRTLKRGASALIVDLRKDLGDATIDEFVKSRARNRLSAFFTAWIFKHPGRMRAYSRETMLALAAEAGFTHCDFTDDAVAMQVWLRKDP